MSKPGFYAIFRVKIPSLWLGTLLLIWKLSIYKVFKLALGYATFVIIVYVK